MNIVIIVAKNLLEYFNSLNAYDMIFMGANIVLMLLIATFIYVLKIKDNSAVKEEVLTDTKDSDISLEALTTKLQNNPLVREDLTPFESEEETKAIISYDELIKTQSIPVLKYKNEEEINGLLVKAIDVNNLIETMDPKPISHPVTYNAMKKAHRAISALKEEELVITLRKLDSIDK